MAFAPAAPDMSAWLGRKYAILQQQANQGDYANKTQRIGVTAAARVDNARADLMPAESAANVAKARAETGLIGEQTNWFGKSAASEIAERAANTRLLGFQGSVLKRNELDELPSPSASSIATILGLRGGSLPSMGGSAQLYSVADTRKRMPLSGATMSERKLPGESEADWLDRINGL